MSLHRLALAAALVAAIPQAYSATTVASVPYGAMVSSIPVGTTGLSFPLIAQDVYSGRITANTSGALTFESGNLGALLNSTGRYYVEIVNGPLEGERFDLNTAATISSGNASATLDLATSSNSTSNSLNAGVLAQSRAVVRPHVTLSVIASMLSPAPVGSADNSVADGIRVYGGIGGSISTYYLRTDGSWRSSAAGSDQRNLVVAPDSCIVFVNRSGAKQWTHLGTVRTNAFRKKLKAGSQTFATGFPIDLSPAQIGAFVDTQDAASIRWVGSDTEAQADLIRVYDSTTQTLKVNYLRADGTSWYASGGSTDLSATPLLKSPAMILVSHLNADPGYVIIRPFSL